jgi:flagellum-specific peptidoglycan hydrolase FlgJ
MKPESIIYETAMQAGIPDPLARLMVAQAKHETGNFASNFFKKYNNAFGYSYVSGAKWQLPTPGTTADNGKPIAAYASLQNSVMEVVDWIKRRVNEGKFPSLSTITTPEQYAQLLKAAGYYGDTVDNYLRGLRHYFAKGIEVADSTEGKIFVTTIVLAGVLYYIYRDI